MSEIFPNSNAELLGEAEDSIGIIDTPAIAGLSGDLVMSEDLDQGLNAQNGTTTSSTNQQPRRRNGSDGNAITTFSNLTTPDNSVLVIVVAAATFLANTNSTKSWKLVRDGTTTIDGPFNLQASHGTQTQSNMRVFTDENPLAGTHTYTLVENDGNGFGAVNSTLFFIKGTDTHAAAITTPATATKQIITPDTHRTHETEVIP